MPCPPRRFASTEGTSGRVFPLEGHNGSPRSGFTFSLVIFAGSARQPVIITIFPRLSPAGARRCSSGTQHFAIEPDRHLSPLFTLPQYSREILQTRRNNCFHDRRGLPKCAIGKIHAPSPDYPASVTGKEFEPRRENPARVPVRDSLWQSMC